MKSGHVGLLGSVCVIGYRSKGQTTTPGLRGSIVPIHTPAGTQTTTEDSPLSVAALLSTLSLLNYCLLSLCCYVVRVHHVEYPARCQCKWQKERIKRGQLNVGGVVRGVSKISLYARFLLSHTMVPIAFPQFFSDQQDHLKAMWTEIPKAREFIDRKLVGGGGGGTNFFICLTKKLTKPIVAFFATLPPQSSNTTNPAAVWKVSKHAWRIAPPRTRPGVK